MTTKEYLGQVKRLKVMIDQKISERKELAADITGVSGISYESDRVTGISTGDAPFVAIVERCMELDKDIEGAVKTFIETRTKIISQIQSVPRTEFMELLYKRYVEYKTLELISVEMNYSFSWARHMHAGALRAFEKIYGKGYKDI